jgi:hypothetical protein|tara:strand:+ start:117 stop:335 length:219 start_codon:yes stop_codon:yes gene_type:complete
MENPEVIKIIENLKGRRPYEEKRAAKLGFASLHEYIEDKIQKKQSAIKNIEETLSETSKVDSLVGKKSCSCC